MPLYFFDVVNGRRLVDPVGTICADLHDAIRFGAAFAKKVATDPKPTASETHIAVLDADGNEISRLAIRQSV